MVEFFQKLFSTDFAPHAYCLRLPGLIQIHVWSDVLIAGSYALIPISLLRLVKRRRDLVFPWMFALFGLFILSCGLTHALGAWTLWHPIYRFDGLVKAITALVSLPTAVLLVAIMPRVLELPSPVQLQTEIAERKRAELQVRELNTELEIRIEERTRALTKVNELLAQSERRRLLAIEAAGVGTWFWNLENGEIFWDQNAKAIFGLGSAAQITLDVFYKAVHPVDCAYVETTLNAARAAGELANLECRIVTPGGAERWIRARGSTDAGGDWGTLKNLQGTFIDITEQKRMELAMAQLASIVESSDDAIIGLDLDGRVTSWNRSASAMFGYQAEEVVGQSVSLLVPPNHPQPDSSTLNRIRSGERIEHFDTVRRHKNGQVIDIGLSISPIINDSGQIVGFSEIARDIGRRKEVETALRNSEERFRTLAETVPDILFVADSRGTINFLSARFFAEMPLLQNGWDPHYAYTSSIHPDDAPHVLAMWETCVRERQGFHAEFRLKKQGGGHHWVVTRALPIVDEQSAIVQWIGASTDIDQLKKTERALVQSNEELRQFAYAAAHDLQEPLRNIVNAAGMLALTAGDRLDGANRQYLQFCVEGAERMHGLVKDLLAFTTAVDGSGTDSPVADTREVMKDVEANLAVAIRENDASIEYAELPAVALENTHLLQLLQNIIGNALKYRSPERTPLIRIAAHRQADDWRFEISDNGIGFSPEYKERIFGVFKRLHHRHEFPGTGIGLAICARIVAHYGGSIWAEGHPDQGAVFSFTLPSAENASESIEGTTTQDATAG